MICYVPAWFFSANNFINLMYKENINLTLAGGPPQDTGMLESDAEP